MDDTEIPIIQQAKCRELIFDKLNFKAYIDYLKHKFLKEPKFTKGHIKDLGCRLKGKALVT